MHKENAMTIPFLKVRDNAKEPIYATKGAAAADLHAALTEETVIAPGERKIIPTGLAVALPEGYVALLFARSGLAFKHGLALANGVGVIDSDYRGEIGAAVINLSDQPYAVQPGERICQMMILPAEQFAFTAADALPESERGAGGFGSTGKQ